MKSFVTSENTATITCPKCNKSRNLQAEGYRNKKHTLKVRCSCNHGFVVMLDFRKHFRKETNLDGTYVMLPPAAGKGKLIIHNISQNGIGFTTGFSINGSSPLKPGQKAQVVFQLDNKKRTRIEKLVIIRSIKNNFVGGEFDLTGGFDKDLGFYLRS